MYHAQRGLSASAPTDCATSASPARSCSCGWARKYPCSRSIPSSRQVSYSSGVSGMRLDDVQRCPVAISERLPIDLNNRRPVPESSQEKDEVDDGGDRDEVHQSEDHEGTPVPNEIRRSEDRHGADHYEGNTSEDTR